MSPRRFLAAALLATLLAGAFFVGRRLRAQLGSPYRHRTVPAEAMPVAGRQLLFVYIGSSRCGPSNQPDVFMAVERSMRDLRSRAAQASLGFVTLGIGRELGVDAALEHLAKIGPFDEVAVGQGDFNQASIRFVTRDHPGIGATPQVLVVERVLPALGTTVDNVAFAERVLIRKVGAADIIRWVQRGSPIMSAILKDNLPSGDRP